MKLIATSIRWEGDEFNGGGRQVEQEIEFTNVKEWKVADGFFLVIKENGEQHAINRHEVNKFKLIAE